MSRYVDRIVVTDDTVQRTASIFMVTQSRKRLDTEDGRIMRLTDIINSLPADSIVTSDRN